MITKPRWYSNGVMSAGPAAIASSIQSLLKLGISIFTVMFLGMPIFGFRFGFENVYETATNRMLRQHCKTPIDGGISLVRPVSSAVVANS